MSATRIELDWVSGQRFDARDEDEHRVTLDGDKQHGLSPMQSLLSSIASCMGIDVVVILEKMRADFERLHISIEGDRMEEPPRYFRRLRLHFDIQGDVPRDKAERAIRLSFDKYCSVFHTMRKDIDVDWSLDLK